MALKIRKGDYVTGDSGRLETASGAEAVLQRVLFRLIARRGALPMWPELGSRLYLLPRASVGQRDALARQYVAEALAQETDLEVTEVTLSAGGDLQVELDWMGEALSVTLNGVIE
jgi:phage gp46-like protein